MALAIKPPRPKRKCGTPVRTGCITCKIRRVKCDEKRPSCNRCTSTGRKCDGYEPVVAKQRTASQPPVPRTISPNVTENPKELKLLHFFSGITAPVFSSNFSSDFNFWRRVLQVGHGEPSIRHAVIALGALHQKFIFNNSQSTGNVLELETFAFQQHTAAISHLHKLMGSQRQRLEITMISCMLFICFDSLLGHHTSAIIHLEAGLKILQSMKIQAAHDPAKLIALGSWERDFVPLLLRMGLQAVLFVNPANKDEKLSLWRALSKAVHKYEDQDQDSPFTSLQEASNSLDRISITIGYERKMVKDRVEAKLTSISSPNNEVVKKHIGDLHTWSHKLNGYLVSLIQNGCMDQRTTRVAALLKIHWLFMMAVANKPEPSDHWFSEILFLCKKLIDTPDANTAQNLSSDLNFTPDMGIIAPLLYIILTFPEDPMISNEAYRLLSRAPRREGMWDGEQARKMVDMFIKARNNAGKIAIVNVLKSPYRGTSLVNNETEGSGMTKGTDEILNRVIGLESSYSTTPLSARSVSEDADLVHPERMDKTSLFNSLQVIRQKETR